MNLYKPKKLRIGLKAYDSTLLDESCNKIIEVVNTNGKQAVGPIPLPTKRRIYCVLRSPHVNKDSREHFEIRTHKRVLEVSSDSQASIVDLLSEIQLDPGVFCSVSIG